MDRAATTERAEPVYTVRLRCPFCNAPDPLVTSTPGDQGDGSILRYRKCRACKKNFREVAE